MSIRGHWSVMYAALGCVLLAGCLQPSRLDPTTASSIANGLPRDPAEEALATLKSIDIPDVTNCPDVPPVAAIYRGSPCTYHRPDYYTPLSEWKSPPPEPDRIIVALWPNGQILWSDDHVHGGPPYHVGQIKKEAVERFLQELADCGAFDPSLFGENRRRYFDCSSICMVATDGIRGMELRADHECVDTSITLEDLGEITLEDLVNRFFGEKDHVVVVWNKVKRKMLALTRKAEPQVPLLPGAPEV